MHAPTLIELAILGCAVIVGMIIGFVISTTDSIWRKRFEQERDYYRQYRLQSDEIHKQNLSRIAALEAAQMAPAMGAVEADLPAVEPHHDSKEPAGVAIPLMAAAAIAPAEAMTPHGGDDAVHVDPAPVETDAEMEPAAEVEAAPVEMAIAEHTSDPSPEPIAPDEDTAEHPAAPLADNVADLSPHVATTGGAIITDPAPANHAGASSELLQIRGIDDALAARLEAAGVTRFEDIERMSAEDEIALEMHLGLAPGIIARDQWRLQAALLGSGDETGHDARFGVTELA